jgi:hypothetical protein
MVGIVLSIAVGMGMFGTLGEQPLAGSPQATIVEPFQCTRILSPVDASEHSQQCENPPTWSDVLRLMPPVAPTVPGVFGEFRHDYRLVVEQIKDTIDNPRFYPLIGPARLHHCHYKCTVYYHRIVELNYPFLVRSETLCGQAVYIDRDHLHVCSVVATESCGKDVSER